MTRDPDDALTPSDRTPGIDDTAPRVLIVAESASARFGGEAALPLHYFRVLRRFGIPVWLLTHARTRDELSALFPGDRCIRYIDDTSLHRFLWSIGQRLPPRLSHFTVGFVSRLSTQLAQRRIARSLVQSERIDVVHQPAPVSPREPSLLHSLGAPVVIGPMNGNMDYPPAFRRRGGRFESTWLRAGRAATGVVNRLMPGKRRAAVLVVANRRTRDALPLGATGHIVELVENGIDLGLWHASPSSSSLTREARAPAPVDPERPTQFIAVGRLVDWKAIDFLLRAFQRAASQVPMQLEIVGDGEQRAVLESLAASLGIRDAVRFAGWQTQEACATRLGAADCLVLPSLLECGGAVVLEAMAMGKPVVATAWGGPVDYLDDSCGILVAPSGPEAFIAGLCEAMLRIARSPADRAAMGARGLEKVRLDYDWDVKARRMLELYAMARARPVA